MLMLFKEKKNTKNMFWGQRNLGDANVNLDFLKTLNIPILANWMGNINPYVKSV